MTNQDYTQGYIIVPRYIFDDLIFANPELFKTYMALLVKANHKEKSFAITVGKGLTEITLQRGQVLFGRKKWATYLNIGESKLKRHIDKLQKLKYIDVKSNNHSSTITLLKYNEMQDPNTYKIKESDQPSNNERTAIDQPSNTNNNYNTLNNKKKERKNTLKKSYHRYFETVDYEKDFVLDKTEPEEVRFSKWYFNLLPVEKRKLYKFNKNTLADWCDTYDKLIRLDGYTKDEIKAVCEFARNDSFWSNNFYSPTKLRVFKKEHGVKVIVQLIEAMNKKETKTKAYSQYDQDGFMKINEV